MSKKQLLNRLDSLFAALDQQELTPPVETTTSLPGWSWECDARGKFTEVSPEVLDCLGIQNSSFIGQSIFTFALASQSISVLPRVFDGSYFPADADVYYQSREGAFLPVRLTIFSRPAQNGEGTHFHGIAQILQGMDTPIPAEPEIPAIQAAPIPAPKPQTKTLSGEKNLYAPGLNGLSYHSGKFHVAQTPWTDVVQESIASKNMVVRSKPETGPAVMAVPLQFKEQETGIIEILDETGTRKWNQEERLLVQEIATQLAQALENAQLYATVQSELAERLRAEQEILRRNQDLATLNQISQRLSRYTTQDEIFEQIRLSIGDILDDRNLIIALYNQTSQILSFPLVRVNGNSVTQPDRPLSNGIIDFILFTKNPLFIPAMVSNELESRGIDLPERIPASLMAVPMITGDRPFGVIVVQDFEKENAYTQIQVELLSTVSAQITNALENAKLFEEIRTALATIETRERYQSNAARAVAILTQSGTRALPEVMEALGAASLASRVYFSQINEYGQESYWLTIAEWCAPSTNFDRMRIQNLPVALFPNWARELRESGYMAIHTKDIPAPERTFLEAQSIQSVLLLQVPGKTLTPSFIAFDQIDRKRTWQSDEINALRVAADAIANTFVREDLLKQVQISLNETEALYNTSHRLALASDYRDMLAAICQEAHIPSLNRAELALFTYDHNNSLTDIIIAANWHSGRGELPLQEGTSLPLDLFGNLLVTPLPLYYNDIQDAGVKEDIKNSFIQRRIRSLAILPLWVGKRQLGALLMEMEEKHIFSGQEMRTFPPLVDQMATTVENQRLFEQTQTSLAETELLYQLSEGVSQANDPKDLILLIAQNVMPENAERAALFVIDQAISNEASQIEIISYYDRTGQREMTGTKIPIVDFPLIRTLGTEPYIVNDMADVNMDILSRKTIRAFGIQSGVLVALRSGGRISGLLAVYSSQPTEYSADAIRLLQVGANGIAVALERQRLLREAQRRALELQTAAEIARDTSSTLALSELLDRIVNLVNERFNLYHTAIYLMDEANKYALISEGTGTAGQEMKRSKYKIALASRSIIGKVVGSGKPVIANDTSTYPYYQPHPMLPDTRAEMALPLKLGDRVIGALDLQAVNENTFSQDEITVLQILSDQIAVAIENARSYELAQRAVEDMKEVDRLKSQFLANMSHELRTPLNSIIGFSRVILKGIDGPINDVQQQDLGAIYSSGQHLLSLINNILDISKIEAGKMELQLSEINFQDIVNSAISTTSGIIKDKPIRLYQNVPQDLPVVMADSTRIRQVLLNFLSNAAKFTEEGSITVDVGYETSPDGKPELMVKVIDTGLGIAEKDHYKLFLPFSQVDDSPTRKTGGTGLGLSICRSFIEMHGGRIGLLASEPGKGSTFFFTLPLPVKETPGNENISEPTPNLVLCIDDDPRIISLYERYLQVHGFSVANCTESKLAVQRARELKPMAITLDVMMPERDGWDVLHDLKNDPETRNIPVIMCSILEEEEKGFSMGASDYLLKPFLEEDLVHAILRLNGDGTIKRILVVDDSPDDLRLLQKYIEENTQFKVMTAEGGQQGLDIIRDFTPDAIILDLFMPDTDGFTVLDKLRSEARFKNIPVIILTGADLTPEQHQLLSEFGQQMLSKSMLREKELLTSIENALYRYKS